jgi:transcriptional regulator with PAS, ATPase and Fis domain
LAKAVHELSGRSGAFSAVNCGALPPNLVESTLLGHVRGAFSGADSNQPGMIRAADHGTLFLDEVEFSLTNECAWAL